MLDLYRRLSSPAGHGLAGWRAGTALAYADLDRRARAWCALAARTPGSRIALFHHDSLEFAAALLGAWQAGKTVWLAADALASSCESLRAEVDAFWGEFPASCAPVAPGDGEYWPGTWSAQPPGFAALVVYTSGSTGAPKAIPKRMDQLTSELQALETQFGAGLAGAAIVSTVSHQHIYGLLFKVLWPLAAGRPIHAASIDYPEALAESLGRHPCVLVASPAHLKRLPAHLDWSGAARQLRAVFSSGGLLEPDAAQGALALLGQAPVEVYGSSESGGIAWRRQAPGAADGWQPLPGVEWRVTNGEQVLEVCSRHAGEGWLEMADRAAPAGTGRFHLRGRSDRIVKIEEKRISLEAVEAALVGSGFASEARVVPCAAASRQVLAAFVVPTKAGQALLDQHGKNGMNDRLRGVLAGVVEPVALPRRWRYLDRLPVNAQGKTTNAQLLALLDTPVRERPRQPSVRELEAGPGRVLLELVVPPDLLYFDGHFTVAPVLPGVVQVDWAILYGRRHFALAPAFRSIQALKFQQMVRPGVPVQLELVHDQVKGSLNFRYFSAAGSHASGRIVFESD
jgi:acyl-coenzyme A synthetase/AMP-(fatty) acid ligase/3-hydroxymyristoyl/3-hydroxydecanoyl-(acyl carrier protein) dehydratase